MMNATKALFDSNGKRARAADCLFSIHP